MRKRNDKALPTKRVWVFEEFVDGRWRTTWIKLGKYTEPHKEVVYEQGHRFPLKQALEILSKHNYFEISLRIRNVKTNEEILADLFQ